MTAIPKYRSKAHPFDRSSKTLRPSTLGSRLGFLEDGRIKGNISVAIDGEITPLGILEKVGEDSEVHFLPALGGGK